MKPREAELTPTLTRPPSPFPPPPAFTRGGLPRRHMHGVIPRGQRVPRACSGSQRNGDERAKLSSRHGCPTFARWDDRPQSQISLQTLPSSPATTQPRTETRAGGPTQRPFGAHVRDKTTLDRTRPSTTTGASIPRLARQELCRSHGVISTLLSTLHHTDTRTVGTPPKGRIRTALPHMRPFSRGRAYFMYRPARR